MADQDLNEVTAAEIVDEMAVDGLDEMVDGIDALADLMVDAIEDV